MFSQTETTMKHSMHMWTRLENLQAWKSHSSEQFEQLIREKTIERALVAESIDVKQMIVDEMEGCPNYALLEVLSHLRIVKARINKLGY